MDLARERKSHKRGHGFLHLALDDTELTSPDKSPAILALDDALSALEQFDERKARVVEMRFFAGLTIEEQGKGPGDPVLTAAASALEGDFKVARDRSSTLRRSDR